MTDLREALKTTFTAIDELEAALHKVKLASKLGCAAAELKTISVDVPTDKIGRVIGKSGHLHGYFYGLDTKRKLLELENPMSFAEQGKLF